MQLTFDGEGAEVRRQFDAPQALVFAAFANAELVKRWLKPSPEIALDVLAYDFRIGGEYHFAYRTQGQPLMQVSGSFASIEPPARIVFSWNIEPPDQHAGMRSEVRIAVTANNDGCELVIRHVNLSRAGAPQRHAEGWRGALDGLKRLLAERT